MLLSSVNNHNLDVKLYPVFSLVHDFLTIVYMCNVSVLLRKQYLLGAERLLLSFLLYNSIMLVIIKNNHFFPT